MLRMVEQGEIFATIDHKAGMVRIRLNIFRYNLMI